MQNGLISRTEGDFGKSLKIFKEKEKSNGQNMANLSKSTENFDPQ